MDFQFCCGCVQAIDKIYIINAFSFSIFFFFQFQFVYHFVTLFLLSDVIRQFSQHFVFYSCKFTTKMFHSVVFYSFLLHHLLIICDNDDDDGIVTDSVLPQVFIPMHIVLWTLHRAIVSSIRALYKATFL